MRPPVSRIVLFCAVAAIALVFVPWPSVSAATSDGTPSPTGNSDQTGSQVTATTASPASQPTQSPDPAPNSPPDSAPPPANNSNSGGGTPPPPSTSTTASQPCSNSLLPTTTVINPTVGLMPGGTITTPAGPACGRGALINTPAPPTALNMATSPPPNLAPYVAQAFEQIVTNPGTIAAAPPNHTGLVNMPQCYWLTGQSVTGTQTVSMDLKGAPNAAGQQITYHISLTVKLTETTWNFGDGSQQTTTVPIPCVGDSAGGSGLVAHNYVTYSQGQPNGTFLVTAAETYQASAAMTWSDDQGPHTQNVTLNNATTTLTTPPYPVRIDQEEGVGS